MYEFKLPDIGEGLAEAELLEWLVNVGDEIKEGDDVALISTDKVNVDLPSPKSGVVADLPWEVGDVIPVGEVFMRIADPNESPAATPDQEQAPRIKAAPALRRYAKEQEVDLSQVAPAAPDGQLVRADIDAYLQRQPTESASDDAFTEKFKLSGARLAAAKRLAESSRTLAYTTHTL